MKTAWRMVEVFKTNVQEKKEAKELVNMLRQYFPGSRINFDLQDCDKILRVEGEVIKSGEIMDLLTAKGFYCSVLE